MTVRPIVHLSSIEARARAKRWIDQASDGYVVEFRAPKRSDAQNRKMWAMLADISRQASHHGLKLSAEDWKLLALDGLHRDLRLVPNLAGDGVVALDRSSSNLTVAEMGDLIELLYALGAERGVVWSDPSVIHDDPRSTAATRDGAGDNPASAAG